MRAIGLLTLRVTMGGLTIFWGLDKLLDVEHSVRVSESFYLGVGANATFLNVFGGLQALVGALIVVGWLRRYTYPVLFVISLTTALGVWRSIVDPWGWYLEGTNVLFYPSAIILSASLVLWGFMDEDRLSVDGGRRDPFPL